MMRVARSIVGVAAALVLAGTASADTVKSGSASPDADMKAVLDQLAVLAPKPLESLPPAEARQQPSMSDAVVQLAQSKGTVAPEKLPPVGRVESVSMPGPATGNRRPPPDLDADRVSGYVYLGPNLCNDMHDSAGCPTPDNIANGDAWLAREMPKILASKAYLDGGAIFITWDESEGPDVPIGMIALSPLAKPGYSNSVSYTHSSLLRTMQNVFSLRPFMRDAANATPLDDLFVTAP